MIKVGVIGAGNMGLAIIKSIRKKYSVSVCEKSVARRRHLKTQQKLKTKDLKTVVRSSKVIILAVKPQNIGEVLKEVQEYITKRHLVISIAAGITSSYIEKKLGRGIRVVRTMPNMPAQIGKGITAISQGKYATRSDVNLVGKIFNCVGKSVVVKEDLIDAITAVSGSGPAYVFLFVECLMKAAQSLGLSSALSKELVEATLLGSGDLLVQQKENAADLRGKVTSKGGTTQAAMNVFMKNKIDGTFTQALKAAKKRSKELSKRG